MNNVDQVQTRSNALSAHVLLFEKKKEERKMLKRFYVLRSVRRIIKNGIYVRETIK